jgi:uncharacterized protein YkwD
VHGETIERHGQELGIHETDLIVTPVSQAFSLRVVAAIVVLTMRWITLLLLAGLLVVQTGTVAAAPPQNDLLITRVLELTNLERQNAGLGPLALSPELSDAALGYSEVLASTGCFEHTCGAVPNFADRVGQSGYTGWTALAENIAAGYPTPEAVVSGWMNSPGHRANILSPKYTEIGVGVVNGAGKLGTYWTEEFGARPGVSAPVPVEAPTELTADDGGSGG